MSTDYTTLITSEHADKPNFVATVALTAGAFGGISDTLLQMSQIFNVDTAVGDQLDKIGEWVGVSRIQNAPITDVFFSFDIAGLGWDEGSWRSPFDPTTGIISLDDRTYRAFIKATIALNYWDGTVGQAQEIGMSYLTDFGLIAVVLDNMDMSMDVLIIGSGVSQVLKSLFQQGLFPPKAAGVRINNYYFSDTPLFGLDLDTLFVKGLDEGAFSSF